MSLADLPTIKPVSGIGIRFGSGSPGIRPTRDHVTSDVTSGSKMLLDMGMLQETSGSVVHSVT